MLATQGFLSPHLHHSRLKYLTDLSEFSGSGIVIKDLDKLRNRDVLKFNTEVGQPIDIEEKPFTREEEYTRPSVPTSTSHQMSTLRTVSQTE